MTTGRLHLSNTFLVLELVAEDDDRLEPASASASASSRPKKDSTSTRPLAIPIPFALRLKVLLNLFFTNDANTPTKKQETKTKLLYDKIGYT